MPSENIIGEPNLRFSGDDILYFPWSYGVVSTKFGGSLKGDIIELPKNTTDWEIDEYDGSESITCVVDGKIKHLY